MKMQNSKVLKAILIICGVIFILAGSVALFSPVGFTERNGIDIAGNLSLFSDYRAMGGLILGPGIIILLGAIHHRMAFTSTVVAAVVYMTFSLGRILSILLDGLPAEGLIRATVLETVLGLLAVFALVKYRDLSTD